MASLKSAFSGALGKSAGQLLATFAVRRWGTPGGLTSGSPGTLSPTMGEPWTLRNYLVCLLAGYAGSKLMGKFGLMAKHAPDVFRGACELARMKLLYTEVVGRSTWAQSTFGEEGDVVEDQTGTTWMERGGQWQSMQGVPYGALVSASNLDGLQAASHLDGGLGHFLPSTTPAREAQVAEWMGSGHRNPYAAAYLGDAA